MTSGEIETARLKEGVEGNHSWCAPAHSAACPTHPKPRLRRGTACSRLRALRACASPPAAQVRHVGAGAGQRRGARLCAERPRRAAVGQQLHTRLPHDGARRGQRRRDARAHLPAAQAGHGAERPGVCVCGGGGILHLFGMYVRLRDRHCSQRARRACSVPAGEAVRSRVACGAGAGGVRRPQVQEEVAAARAHARVLQRGQARQKRRSALHDFLFTVPFQPQAGQTVRASNRASFPPLCLFTASTRAQR